MLDHLLVLVSIWWLILHCFLPSANSTLKANGITTLKKEKANGITKFQQLRHGSLELDLWNNISTGLLDGSSEKETEKHLHNVHPSLVWERRCHCMALYSNCKDQYCLLQHWLDLGSWDSQEKGAARIQASMLPSSCDTFCQRSDHESTNTQTCQGSHGSHQ